MVSILDVIFAVILIIFAAIGLFKGMVKSLIGVLSTVFSVCASYFISKYLSDVLYDKLFGEKIVAAISEKIEETGIEQTAVHIKSILDSIPKFIYNFASKHGFSSVNISKEISKLDLSGEDAAYKLSETVVRPAMTGVMRIIIFIALVIICSIILGLLARVICKTVDNSPVRLFDRLLGLAFGAFKGAIIVVVLAVVIVFAAGLVPEKKTDSNKSDIDINSSYVISFLQEKSDMLNIKI